MKGETSYKGGMGLGCIGESKQNFQIRRKASLEEWRREESKPEININKRILCIFEGNCICTYLSIPGSHMYICCLHYSANIMGYKPQFLFIIVVSTILGRGPLCREGARWNEGKACPSGPHRDYSRIITSSDTLLSLKRMIRIELWVPTQRTSKPTPNSVYCFFFSQFRPLIRATCCIMAVGRLMTKDDLKLMSW